MVVDSSALISIALEEPGWQALVATAARERCFMAAPTALEVHIVLRRRVGERADLLFQGLLREMDITLVAFSDRHQIRAAEAFDKYGKGRHKAALNFGDCMSYALATDTGQPLLFVGNDFIHTDVQRA